MEPEIEFDTRPISYSYPDFAQHRVNSADVSPLSSNPKTVVSSLQAQQMIHQTARPAIKLPIMADEGMHMHISPRTASAIPFPNPTAIPALPTLPAVTVLPAPSPIRPLNLRALISITETGERESEFIEEVRFENIKDPANHLANRILAHYNRTQPDSCAAFADLPILCYMGTSRTGYSPLDLLDVCTRRKHNLLSRRNRSSDLFVMVQPKSDTDYEVTDDVALISPTNPSNWALAVTSDMVDEDTSEERRRPRAGAARALPTQPMETVVMHIPVHLAGMVREYVKSLTSNVQ